MSRIVGAIYPGTFDPVTNGHLEIIERGCRLFGRVIVAVSQNADKKPLFSVEERLALLSSVTHEWENVEIDSFKGLLVDYAVSRGASAIIRGIRAVSDFDYEFQMALMNRRLEDRLETVFLVPAEEYTYLSSSLVKEVFSLGGSVRGLVPPEVERGLLEKLGRK
ncbi:MAG: pantetheine-phosphate adenylyltransferase [Acidobacteriota bacterium]